MDTLMQLVTKGNDFLWSFLLLVLLCGTGLYYTIRLRFIQVRKFGEGVRQVFGHFSMNGEKHEKGEMTPFHRGSGRYRKSCRSGDRPYRRRSGRNLLDVGQRIPRNGDDLWRGSSGTDI